MNSSSTLADLLSRIVCFFSLCFIAVCTNAQPTYFNKVFTGPTQVTSLAFGNNTYVGTGGGFWYVSHDGESWTAFQTSPIINQGRVAYGNGMFLAFGTNYQNHANYVLQSTNGTAWTILFTPETTLTAAAYNTISNIWVLVGSNEIATATITSSNWNWSEFQPSFSPACITYGNGYFVIGAYVDVLFPYFDQYNYCAYSSSDGVVWQYDSTLSLDAASSEYSPVVGIAYGNGAFVATVPGGNNGNLEASVFSSTNLTNWTPGPNLNDNGYENSFPISFGGNCFFTELGPDRYTSPDGFTWSYFYYGSSFYTITYGQDAFVAADVGVDIYQSDSFAANTNQPSNTLGISTFPGVTINGTAGGVYQVQSSTDLVNWQTLTNVYLTHSPLLWFDTISPFGSQNFYRTVLLQ